MPTYCFSCECGSKFEKVLPMKDSGKLQKCECGKRARRDFVAEHTDGVVDSQMREYTMEGSRGCRPYAMSYLPHQMTDTIRKKHLGREFKEVNGCMMPVIKHRQDFKKYMKEYSPDYVEYS